MALRKLIAGNWKMNGSLASLAELDGIVAAAMAHTELDVAICPPATLIAAAKARAPGLAIGGQDCHWNQKGAHTGCISPAMLAEAGATYVIVGHSERRTDYGETSEQVRSKAEAASAAGMVPIICVGETEAQRDAEEALMVVTGQVAASVPGCDPIVVAYEPVWAIGTGRTPSAQDIGEMHAAIRTQLASQLGNAGRSVRILYGGSVKPENARDLLHIADVDGALVGGASLKASDFAAIIEGAAYPLALKGSVQTQT